MTARLLLAALLQILRPPSAVRERLAAHYDEIAAQAAASAERYGVPVGLLLTVGYAESQLGSDPRAGGSWGAPVSRGRRNVAGTSDHAARALATSYRVCGSWRGAVSRFRCGLCHCNRVEGYSPTRALRLAERVYRRAGLAMPERLR